MPTENRSSNTEQMVSVPREWVENYAGLLEERCAYEASERVQALLAQPAAQHQGEAEGYPPCDYCGLTPSHHPWHGSGLLEGVENRHIHACNKCRGKLPAHQGEPLETAVFNDPLYNAESDARNASSLLEEVLEWFDDGVGRSQAEFKLMRKIGAWLGRSAPSADGESDECAHSYANGVGCPECGKEFGAEPSAPVEPSADEVRQQHYDEFMQRRETRAALERKP